MCAQVELYAILDHAEVRFGDDRLEKVATRPPPTVCPNRLLTRPEPIPPSDSSCPQILSIVAEELPAEPTPAEEDAAAE